MSDGPSEPGGAQDFVVLGRVLGAYGIKGWIRLQPYGDDPLAWSCIERWWFSVDAGATTAASGVIWSPHRLMHCREHGGILLAQLEGIADRNAAEMLAGQLMAVPRANLPAVGDGEYYWGELQGMRVRNVAGEDLGKVSGLIDTGANDVLVVAGGDGRERLLPFVGDVVLEVDRIRRELQVDWGSDW